MFRDPIQSINAPPPRYILESDSSDEEGQGVYPSHQSQSSSSSSRICAKPFQPPVIDIKSVEEVGDGLDVVLGLGQAGRYLLKVGSKRKEVLQISQRESIIGQGYAGATGKSLLIVLEESEIPVEGVHALAKKLSTTIKAGSWTIATTYLPSIYVVGSEDAKTTDKGTAPIRYLPISSTSSDNLQKAGVELYSPPNYITGIAAALTSLITHSSSPLPPQIPITALLLPLPLSSIPFSHLTSSFTTTSSITPQELGATGSNWLETDDEPYVAPGMGRTRRAPLKSSGDRKEDYDSMYM